MTAQVLNILAFVAGTLGAAVGLAGSYKMAQAYHAFTFRSFAAHAFRVVWRYLRGDAEGARRSVATAAQLGLVNPEDRTLSLIGLHLVFAGFALQVAGGALALLASLMKER